ncbi:shikimate kinase [Arthrobacter sp. CAN_A6]|uniref:hypothetical protein n=1 Tax=Arthrobacter sp. CAN_A6 TaxID=2787721 RepID=UPI0018CB87DE
MSEYVGQGSNTDIIALGGGIVTATAADRTLMVRHENHLVYVAVVLLMLIG